MTIGCDRHGENEEGLSTIRLTDDERMRAEDALRALDIAAEKIGDLEAEIAYLKANTNMTWFCYPDGFKTTNQAKAEEHFKLHIIEFTCPFCQVTCGFHTQEQFRLNVQKHLDWHANSLAAELARLSALVSDARRETLELAAEWLRHNKMEDAAFKVLLIRPGVITDADRAWADQQIAARGDPYTRKSS